MDWLKKHQVLLNLCQNTFTYLNKDGERTTIVGIPRKVSVRQISSLQRKKDVRKGCNFFVVHVINNEQGNNENKMGLRDIPILKDFVDVFPEVIPALPPK